MSIRLSVTEKSESGASAQPAEHVLEGPSVTLGRDKACEIVLARQAVSRSHARITMDGDLSFIEDLGSSFGTQVNGEALPKGEKRLLKTGDVIVIAQFDVGFTQLDARPAPGGDESTSFVSRAMVRDALRGVLSAEDPFFRFMNGDREGDKLPIAEAQELLVGRDPQAEIRLTDDLVSRRHAKFRRDMAGVHVEDLESRNGIKVNKRKVRHRTLKDRDEVEIGAARLLFVDPNAVGEAPQVEVSSLVAPRPGGPPRTSSRALPRSEAAPSTSSKVDPRRDAPRATAAKVDPRQEPAEKEPPAPEPPAPAPAPAANPAPEASEEPAREHAADPEPEPDGELGEGEEGLGATLEGPGGSEDDPAWITGPQEVPARAALPVPGGSRTVVMAGLGLVGILALVLMIAILAGA